MKAPAHIGMAALTISAVAALSQLADAATRVQKTFGGWQVDCNEQDNGKKACALQYALVAKKDNRPVFSWMIVRGKEGEPNKVLLRTPTGVLLTEGVNVGIEGAESVKINYLTCGPQACVAEFDLTEQWQKTLSSYPKAIIAYKAVNQAPIKHEIDLKQFSDALKFFESQNAAKN